MFLPIIVYGFYRLLYATWRFRIIEHPVAHEKILNKSPLILAHWHGDELALLPLVRQYKLATMTSTSRDGQLIDYVIHRLGGETSRGSSTRGGVSALKGLIRLLRSGRITSMAVDGPKGPIYKPKPGVFELARLGGASILPVGVAVNSKYTFTNAWNKTFLPLPFSKVIAYVGEPLNLADDSFVDPKSDALATALADRIDAARQSSSKIIATS